jgi:hypothetical protein
MAVTFSIILSLLHYRIYQAVQNYYMRSPSEVSVVKGDIIEVQMSPLLNFYGL